MLENITVDGHRIITDPVEAYNELSKNKHIAYDSETNGLSPWRSHIQYMQFYGSETGALALIRVRNGVIPKPMIELFNCGHHEFTGHNVVGFDIPFLHTHGVEWWRSSWYDSLVAETVVTTFGRRNVSVSLRNSLKRRLGKEIDKAMQTSTWNTDELSEDQVVYALDDVISIPALRRSQEARAAETEQSEALDMEMQLVPVFAWMTINGLPMDLMTWQRRMDEYAKIEEERRTELSSIFGDINLGSWQQLVKAFKRHGITAEKTNKEVLTEYILSQQPNWELVDKVLRWREPKTRLKTWGGDFYFDKTTDGWLHPRFWQCSTDTSRVSSSDPNLQQWPKDMRDLIGHIPGKTIVSPDYSQIEVRVGAEIFEDEALLLRLEHDDIHTAIAEALFADRDITPQLRKNAKAAVFTLIFGGGAKTVVAYARNFGSVIDLQDAYDIEYRFFEEFKGLAAARANARRMARERRFVAVRLPNGLQRHLSGPDLTSTRLLNTIIQGTAAVGLKYGLLDAHRQGLVAWRMGATVHDENVSVVDDNEADDYAHALNEAMLVGMRKVCPIAKSEISMGKVWQP